MGGTDVYRRDRLGTASDPPQPEPVAAGKVEGIAARSLDSRYRSDRGAHRNHHARASSADQSRIGIRIGSCCFPAHGPFALVDLAEHVRRAKAKIDKEFV